jgi:preprotein translocase subunit SecD
VYIALTLAIFKLIGVTLTLAGIAGFILSIGMAVDANVLIFERLKEELKSGKSLKAAVEEGFTRAWTSIRDGNMSTLITCVLLIWFGTSFVKGFAVTLAIGILLSMFSAITITRVMLRFVVPWFAKRDGGFLFLGSSKEENTK